MSCTLFALAQDGLFEGADEQFVASDEPRFHATRWFVEADQQSVAADESFDRAAPGVTPFIPVPH